jgi:predicted secreted acid phosphatase
VRKSVESAVAIDEAAAREPSFVLSAEPMENLDIARYRIADYGDCVGNGGCYWADLDTQFKRAERILDMAVSTHKKSEKLAVVFDVDETSLSSYCEMKHEDFGYIPELNNVWTVSPEAAVAIPGAVRLFNRAKAAGVSVFFITGRPDTQREATARNLEASGFHGWKRLDLRTPEEHHVSTIAYKSGRRGHIVAEGYRIVLSVGDQWSDLSGDPKAETSVKLPNPFYFLP